MVVAVFDRLHAWLIQADVQIHVQRHEPVRTSERAAAIRGTDLASGAKALIIKAGADFVLCVLPADRKLDSRKARQALGSKSLRFATRDEIKELIALEPGAIPPFGSLFNLRTYCDPTLGHNPSINFNAGDQAISIQMPYSAYVDLEKPTFATLT